MSFGGFILAVTTLFILVNPALAAGAVEDRRVTEFRLATLDALFNADSTCLAKIPYVSIEKLRTAASKSKVSIASIEAGGRTGGLWTKDSVWFNPDFFLLAPQINRSILSIHEFLGQSHGGYIDDSYSFSIAIALCSQPGAVKLLSELKWPKTHLEKRFILEARGGGSTAVGGGGDNRDIQLKIEAVQILLGLLKAGEREFLSHPIMKILSGLLFVNIYRSKEAAKDHFNIYIPRNQDRDIQAVAIVHPETFDALYALPSNQRIVQTFRLAIAFSDLVLAEKN